MSCVVGCTHDRSPCSLLALLDVDVYREWPVLALAQVVVAPRDSGALTLSVYCACDEVSPALKMTL